MAGVDPSGTFVASTFRATIRATMTMGLPDNDLLKPTFYFASDDTYTSHSRSGLPWDLRATPVPHDPDLAPVQVPCTVEVDGNAVDLNAIGEFTGQNAVVSLCDVDYAAVTGFVEVSLGGSIYQYSKLKLVTGLFDFTLFQVEVVAKDVR